MPDLSVIIPTWNRASILALALRRLAEQDLSPDAYEVILIDDASDDSTPITAEAAQGWIRQFVYRRQSRKSSAGAARNVGIGLARAPLLVFLDDDALVDRDFLRTHREAHRTHGSRIVTGPIIEITDPKQANARPRFGQGWHRNPFPTGNASVATQFVLQAGCFDERFTGYGWEDPELYMRLARLDLGRHFETAAPIFHCKPMAVRQDFPARLRREQQRGAMGAYFYAKHPSLGVGIVTKAHPAIRALDRLLAPLLRLDQLADAALQKGVTPPTALQRLLVANHVEIKAARDAWRALGRQQRRALAERGNAG
jgi:glycosyltransferase involved in cell wall biosynthesis